MTELDAVLFDAGGVLVVPRPDVLGEVLEPYGAHTGEATLLRAHFAGVHTLDWSDEAAEDWDAYLTGYIAAAGVPEEHATAAFEAMDRVFDHWLWCHPFPGSRDVLAELHERDVPIGIVSNAIGQVEGELCRVGLCQVGGGDGVPVACVVDSHVVGVSKPDPAIFRTALEALGLEASPRIGYVGDTVFNDVRAARAAGLTPLLHDPYGFHQQRPVPSGPYRTVTELQELLDLV